VTRYTFVIQVHPDGISTIENLATHERVQIADFATVGAQIETWLAGVGADAAPAAAALPSEHARGRHDLRRG
jgi:hypothetical protein